MQNIDLSVLRQTLAWITAGHDVVLYTVVQTWGSAPRPVGSMFAIRHDGVHCGSVSGGCIEDDLLLRNKTPDTAATFRLLTYGNDADEAARFKLPCGGVLQLLQEPIRQADAAWLATVLAAASEGKLITRTVNVIDGSSSLSPATAPVPVHQATRYIASYFTAVYGPAWRLLIIGAGPVGLALAQMASLCDFAVTVCEPRADYAEALLQGEGGVIHGVQLTREMPDDAVNAFAVDSRCAIVALSHDRKLDDLALLEALTSQAMYVGAIGSRRNQAARKARLAEHFGLSVTQLARLHGPVGLAIGAKTPAEIAISILAEIIQTKHQANHLVKPSADAQMANTDAICTTALS